MRYIKPLRLCQELKKSKALEEGRLLGLDVGVKYVGLAVSDPQKLIASPLSVLIRKKNNIDLMVSDFQKLVSKFSVAGFIIGYPYGGGKSDTSGIQIGKFMYALTQTEKLKDLRYTYWDEGFTSRSVEVLLKPLASHLHPVDYKSIMDKFAAVDILQAYLDHMNRIK